MRPLTFLTVAAVLALVVAALVAEPVSGASRGWQRPVPGEVARLFSVGPDRFAAGQHRGVDLGAPPGTRVLAACTGRVSFAGRVPRGGGTVSVRCGPLVATHQGLGVLLVARGAAVARGRPIGTVSAAGRPRPHVHLGARDAATGAYVDPLLLIETAPRVVPLAPPGGGRDAPLRPRGPARPRPAVPPAAAPARAPMPHAVPPAGDPARAGDRRLPWPVWLGLGLVALGLPAGGLVSVRTRRRRRASRRPVVARRALS